MTVVWQQQWITVTTLCCMWRISELTEINILSKINLWVTRSVNTLFRVCHSSGSYNCFKFSWLTWQRAFLCLHTTPSAAPTSETEFPLPAFLSACFSTWLQLGMPRGYRRTQNLMASLHFPPLLIAAAFQWCCWPAPCCRGSPTWSAEDGEFVGSSNVSVLLLPVMCFWGIIQAANTLD